MSVRTVDRLISADDHVDLAHDRVKAFLAARYHDNYDAAVARVEAELRRRSNVETNRRWREQHNITAGAPEGKGHGSNDRHPAFGRPGHHDPVERLRDMDADGVDASVSYCEVSAFRYLYLLEEGAAEATRAFNMALSEFASADPKRLIVSCQIPIHDIEMAVNEVRWAAANGCRSLQLPVFPAELGLPDYWDTRYDPLWRAIQDADLPVCLHIGLKLGLEDIIQRDPTPQRGIFIPMVSLVSAEALGMWVMTGVLERHPYLKLVFVEPGIGWVAWWLDFVDDMVARQGYEFPGNRHEPSHYFHRNVHLTFVDEPHVIRAARETLGIENVLWSSDYPHPVGSWPHSRATVDRIFAGVPAPDIEMVCSSNAARFWNLRDDLGRAVAASSGSPSIG